MSLAQHGCQVLMLFNKRDPSSFTTSFGARRSMARTRFHSVFDVRDTAGSMHMWDRGKLRIKVNARVTHVKPKKAWRRLISESIAFLPVRGGSNVCPDCLLFSHHKPVICDERALIASRISAFAGYCSLEWIQHQMLKS
jgi:hypothetical protein